MKPAFDLLLYLVTDPALVAARGLAPTIEAALRGGVTLVQLRDKHATDAGFARQAEALLNLLRPAGVPLIVNDRPAVAKAVGADGVHIGQDDGDPRRVRDLIGDDMILGLSAGTPAEFAAVPPGVVDYLGVGPVFATGTKPDHDPPIGIEGLAALMRRRPLPCVAIGGISLATARTVKATGVEGVAVVSAICAAADPEAAARAFRSEARMTGPHAPATRRAALAGLAAAAGAIAAPAVTRAETPLKWRMVTSWPRNLPGPGVSAKRLAERIRSMSGSRLDVEVFAAGEIVPAFAVLDAVSTGVAEMGHTASFFWAGKAPAAALFTTAPFGMGPVEHLAWIQQRGGQALWDRLYEPFKVRGLLAGNTGPSMGGWFRKEVRDVADVAALRIRVQGLGGDVYQQLGATPMAIPPGDVAIALERGTIDAVELLWPVNDLPLGLNRHAPFYYAPGFNKPNGAAEALVSTAAWEALSPELQGIVRNACEAEHAAGLADAEFANAGALVQLVTQGVKVTAFPPDVLAAARKAAETVLDRIAARDAVSAEIVASYRAAAADGKAWARLQGFMAQQMRAG